MRGISFVLVEPLTERKLAISCYYQQVLQIEKKVGHWLSHQHDITSGDDVQPWKLVATWNVDHVKLGIGVYGSNSFSVSESGGLAISCYENPSLSVIYPDTENAPVILSNDTKYHSPTFLKISGKECLAASCGEDGCLYLWDTEAKTSKKAFDPKLAKYMNISKLRDNTIGCAEKYASPDESRRVFILKTAKEEMTLSSTLRLFTPDDIFDVLHGSGRRYTMSSAVYS